MTVRVAVTQERHAGETRVAATPETVKKLIAAGCEVVVVSPSIVLDAFRVMERWGYGFFDSQIIATALACGASILYSEDLHDGQTVDGRLSIRSPFGRPRTEQRAKSYRARMRGVGKGAKSRRGSL